MTTQSNSAEGTTNPSTEYTNPVPQNPVERDSAQHTVSTSRDTSSRAAPISQLAQANFVRPRARLNRYNIPVQIGTLTRTNGVITTTRYADFCSDLFEYLDNLITLNGGNNPIGTYDFIRMCMTLLVFRVQQVREHRLAQRAAANRVALTRTFPVPAALYEVLAGIGEIYLENRGFSYVPNLPAVESPVPDYYQVDTTITLNFITTMDILNKRGLHRSVTFPNLYEGTPYWILNRSVAGQYVTVTGSTGEGTPADGLLCAIVDVSQSDASERRGFVYTDSIHYQTLRHAYFSMN